MATTKQCEQCGNSHQRRRFCSNLCKDRWHNTHNPRGLGLVDKIMSDIRSENRPAAMDEDERIHQAGMEAQEAGWDGHKNIF